ncbi:MAG: hypothetical protein HZC28_20690 [Spirochaetes bacterium]|nr:hypothetical protein [Spirochaetota bacterium]
MNIRVSFLYLLLSGAAFTAPPDAAELYRAVQYAYASTTPASYTADVSGDIIDKQIGTIPQNQLTVSRDRVKLTFYFKQGFAPKMILNNVTPFYEGMFSIFLPHLKFLGCFSLAGEYNSYAKFSTRYSIVDIREKGGMYSVKVRDLKEDASAYGVLAIDKTNYLVTGGEFFYDGKLLKRAAITYSNDSRYAFVSRIDFSDNDAKRPVASFIAFSGQVITKLSDEVFK